jgi:putative ABC transport system permease protein
MAGFLAGVAGAWLPARRAASLPIADLKANRKRREPRTPSKLLKALRILLPIVGLVALLFQNRWESPVLGAVASVALIAAAAILIEPSLGMVGRPIGAVLGQAASVGLRDQSRAPSRAIGASAVLLAGVGLAVWIGNTGQSFERFVAGTSASARSADLMVDGSVDEVELGQNSPRLDEEILEGLLTIPGIELAVGDVMAIATNPEIGIHAVDPGRFQSEHYPRWELAANSLPDALARVSRGEGLLADPEVLRTHRIEVGDTLQISSPTGALDLPIVGVMRTSFITPRGTVVLSRDVYRQAWGDSSIGRAYVALRPGADKKIVRKQILEKMGNKYRIRVIDNDELRAWVAASVQRAFGFLDTMSAITIVVVLIGAADALIANVLERTREIGTLRSLGYSPAAIARMVLAQALAIGIVGSGLAVLVGIGTSLAFVEGVLQAILGWQLEMYVRYAVVSAIALMGIMACVVGALIPAVRASKMSIGQALREQ